VQQVRETIEALDPQGRDILWVIGSDHGMETVRREIDLVAQLVEAGFKESADSGDVVVAPQGTSALLYFSAAARPLASRIADWLKAQDFCDQVFEDAELADVGLPTGGALGLALSMRCDDKPNEFGVPGRSDSVSSPFSSESRPGSAQHGGLGRHEQHPFLFIRGAGLAPGVRRDAASLIDIAPTVLAHLGLPGEGMQGRSLLLA
jgi:arylsulfatase A-like enzyme